jgi:hypothetical protein
MLDLALFAPRCEVGALAQVGAYASFKNLPTGPGSMTQWHRANLMNRKKIIGSNLASVPIWFVVIIDKKVLSTQIFLTRTMGS